MWGRCLACVHCGAKMAPRNRTCKSCSKGAVRRVADRFKLERCVERGGPGLTFLAWDTLEHVPVICRVLLPDAGASAQRTLEREARLLLDLREEPGFPRLVKAGRLRETGARYAIYEAIDALPLAKAVRRLAPSLRIEVMIEAMHSLARLHDAGFVHAYITLDEFLVTSSGQVFLTDLRGAKEIGQPAVGTGIVPYRAPEQARIGAALTPATDVFSLGVALYEALSGKFPYGSRGISSGGAVHLRPRALSDIAPMVPADLDAPILRALELDPAKRFADAEDVRTALDTVYGESTEDDGFSYPFVSRASEHANAIWDRMEPLLVAVGGAAASFGKRTIPLFRWVGRSLLGVLDDPLSAARLSEGFLAATFLAFLVVFFTTVPVLFPVSQESAHMRLPSPNTVTEASSFEGRPSTETTPRTAPAMPTAPGSLKTNRLPKINPSQDSDRRRSAPRPSDPIPIPEVSERTTPPVEPLGASDEQHRPEAAFEERWERIPEDVARPQAWIPIPVSTANAGDSHVASAARPVNSSFLFLTHPPSTVLINGRRVSEAPGLKPVRLAPGVYELVFEFASGERRQFVLNNQAGGAYRVKYSLEMDLPNLEDIEP